MTDTATGSTDVMVVQQDHGWCFSYTCQKRLTQFHTTAFSGHTYSLNWTGTPPNIIRLWLPYADVSREIVVGLHYFAQVGPQDVPFTMFSESSVLDSSLDNTLGRP